MVCILAHLLRCVNTHLESGATCDVEARLGLGVVDLEANAVVSCASEIADRAVGRP